MNFTPQQVSGAGKYNSHVLIGNWNEDLALADVKEKSTKHKKISGQRQTERTLKNIEASKRPAKLSYSQDGFLRYGDKVHITHSEIGRRLAVNSGEKISTILPGIEEYQVSGAAESSLRTSLVVLPVPGSGKEMDSVVQYGEQVVLATNPSFRVNPETGFAQDPFYLISSQNTVNGCSGTSGQQEVRSAHVLNPARCGEIRWRIEQLVVKPPELNENRSVKVFEPLQIVHCVTGKALGMDSSYTLYNDHGPELEVFCNLHKRTNKVHVMIAEGRGTRTGDHRVSVQSQNWWVIETAYEPIEESKTDFEPLPLTFEGIFKLVQMAVCDNHEQLLTLLEQADIAKDKAIDRVSFKWVLKDMGVNLSEDEFACLLDRFEGSKGEIPFKDFLDELAN